MRNRWSDSGFSMLEMLVGVGILSVVSLAALPMTLRTSAEFRLRSDAQNLNHSVGLAKMRAATRYTRERVYVDLSTNSYYLQRLDRTTTPNSWVTDDDVTKLSTGITFSTGAASGPPPNTQGALGQSPACLDNNGNAI